MQPFRCAIVSVVKHDYIARAVAAHPRFELVVVADESSAPEWAHTRNQDFANRHQIPYVRDVARAVTEHNVQVAIVSSEAERHCQLSIQAAECGAHIVQDKPMSNALSECDRLVDVVERQRVRFLLWNRNFLPAVLHARDIVRSGEIGKVRAVHVDFYFSKDAGPPKGTRGHDDPPLSWLEHQIAAHADGSDGGVGSVAMGELAIEGIYPLGYIRMLLDDEVQRVFARTAAKFHQLYVDNDVDDLASVTLEMRGGVLGSLCIGRIGAASHPDIGEIKLHVLGDQGALVISEARPEVGVHYRGQPAIEFRHRRVANDNDYLLMENLAQAIDTEGKTILDAHDGRAICAIVQAASQSGRSGQPETVAHRED